MSVAVYRSASGFMTLWAAKQEENFSDQNKHNQEAEKPPGQYLDVWSSIQAKKVEEKAAARGVVVYVHPLMRRSSSLLSQKSLELCTENLGSETGSDFFVSDDEEIDFFSYHSKKQEDQVTVTSEPEQHYYSEEEEEEENSIDEEKTENESKQKLTFNYHCSGGGGSSRRSFPPPLPSISRRDGPCLQMRPHRRDGRLVMEAVTVPSQNYLHAERQGGRLLLSFINTTTISSSNSCNNNNVAVVIQEESSIEETEDEEEEEIIEAEEEEVEVVDRGTVIEVKVSTQPQQSIGGTAAVKVHRSSIVINKFVSCLPTTDNVVAIPDEADEQVTSAAAAVRRVSASTTTTAAAAAVAASSVSALSAMDGSHSSTNENKLLFASKRRNREELLHDMRRCSQLREPLFIWEPCCIATSS